MACLLCESGAVLTLTIGLDELVDSATRRMDAVHGRPLEAAGDVVRFYHNKCARRLASRIHSSVVQLGALAAKVATVAVAVVVAGRARNAFLGFAAAKKRPVPTQTPYTGTPTQKRPPPDSFA